MAIVKKRCIRCRKPVRDDGTCQNPKCVRYVPEVEEAEETTDTEETTESTEETK